MKTGFSAPCLSPHTSPQKHLPPTKVPTVGGNEIQPPNRCSWSLLGAKIGAPEVSRVFARLIIRGSQSGSEEQLSLFWCLLSPSFASEVPLKNVGKINEINRWEVPPRERAGRQFLAPPSEGPLQEQAPQAH